MELLAKAREALAAIRGPWTVEDLEAALRGLAEREGVKPKAIFQPLRVAIAGTTVSPGIFETVALLGREETLARIEEALNRASTFADTAEGGR
jgi:glutamyl-tRNA synthetase